jgi:RNA polymerase sigma-70 factor (ECF subfamily)
MRGVSLKRRLRSVEVPSTDDDPLAALMRRAGRGDASAFEALYDALAAFVHGVVLRVVRDPAQAEEVTQEVFVELWRLAARHDETLGSVHAWTGTIAHRRAVDRVRSEQARRDRTERVGASRSIDHDHVTDEVEATMETTRLRRALDRLTAMQRESLELAYYGGHTYREVAVLLGVPEGTVKTRIRDALIRLRDEMGVTS